jgi:hypothetical protein
VYPCQSHLGMGAYGWSAVGGVGRAKRQLQQRGLGCPFCLGSVFGGSLGT